MMKVYHSRNWALNSKLHFEDLSNYKPFMSNYKHVANVEGEDKERAYMLTNHIDVAWWENEGVELVEESRSTSVGDLVDVDGVLWVCGGCGWEKVEWSSNDDPCEVHTDEWGSYVVPKVAA